jgi:hypothetical protein
MTDLKAWRKVIGLPDGTEVRLIRDRVLPYVNPKKPKWSDSDVKFKRFHKGTHGVILRTYPLTLPGLKATIYETKLDGNGFEVWLTDDDIEEI